MQRTSSSFPRDKTTMQQIARKGKFDQQEYHSCLVHEARRIAFNAGDKIRCVGSALSPNGIAFNEEGMVSLALMDRVLNVDTSKDQVTVQAGARVEEVVEAIRPYGLTLQNYASIREQSIGGFTQVQYQSAWST